MEYLLESTDLLKHTNNFDETYRFIKEAKDNNGTVLVHCKMGMSRSASSVIAFLMKEYKLSNKEALEKVKKARPIVQPNSSFVKQLIEYNGILNAKMDYQKSLSECPEKKPAPGEYDRKKSAVDRCKHVDVRGIAGSRFSTPSSVSECEEDKLSFRERSSSVNTND